MTSLYSSPFLELSWLLCEFPKAEAWGPCRTRPIAIMSVRLSVCSRSPAFIYGPIFTNEGSNDSSNAADVPFGHYNHVRQLEKKLWAKNCLDTRNLHTCLQSHDFVCCSISTNEISRHSLKVLFHSLFRCIFCATNLKKAIAKNVTRRVIPLFTRGISFEKAYYRVIHIDRKYFFLCDRHHKQGNHKTHWPLVLVLDRGKKFTHWTSPWLDKKGAPGQDWTPAFRFSNDGFIITAIATCETLGGEKSIYSLLKKSSAVVVHRFAPLEMINRLRYDKSYKNRFCLE